MKQDKQRRAMCDAKKREKGLYKPSIWVHTSWKGTKEYQKIKDSLSKEIKTPPID